MHRQTLIFSLSRQKIKSTQFSLTVSKTQNNTTQILPDVPNSHFPRSPLKQNKCSKMQQQKQQQQDVIRTLLLWCIAGFPSSQRANSAQVTCVRNKSINKTMMECRQTQTHLHVVVVMLVILSRGNNKQ